MGVRHQYYTNSSFHLTNPLTYSVSKDHNDNVWNNLNDLNLLDTKRSSIMTTTTLQVLPSIDRLFTIFDSICPNIYRIHCSDTLRILNEIICLSNEYLHIHPSSLIPTNELLHNEKHFNDFIYKLNHSSLYPTKTYPSLITEIHCFGQGIHTCDYNNELNQPILFCFELTSTTKYNISLPINILILDPNNKLVPNDVKYINTYNQGYTKLFSCSYTPRTNAGIHKISIIYNNIKLINHLYTVFIRNSNSYRKEKEQLLSEEMIKKKEKEIPQYELEGDGCSTKVIVNSTARFRLRILSSTLSYYNPTVDSLSLSILDPCGHTIIVQRRILSADLLELTYQPMSIGEHKLLILFNNNIDRELAIDVIPDELNFLSKLKPFGPGLQRAIVGLTTEFYVDLNQTTNTNIHFRLEPSYQAEIDYEQQMATVRYIPLNEGDCPIHILENDKEISHSPFLAHVEKNTTLREKPRIRVMGLSKQITLHRPVEFQVFIDNPFDDTNNLLHVDILTDDNNSPPVSIRRRHRSSYVCSFLPVTLGRYFISIDYAGIVAEHNPFYSHVIQEKDILLTGPAMNNQCLTLNKPTHFSFALKDFLTTNFNEKISPYESGYSSNDDISSKSSSSTDIPKSMDEDETNNYRVTITDGHGNIKPNVTAKEIYDNNVRVDFTPDEQILYINISCTW